MTCVEYEYFTSFEFPFAIGSNNDFEKSFKVDQNTYYIVKDNQSDNKCTFTLVARSRTEDPENHDPTDYEKHAYELIYLYDIMRMAVNYLTGHIVKGHSSLNLGSTISDYSIMPEIRHNFYEKKEELGMEKTPMKGRVSYFSHARIEKNLTPDLLEKLKSITRDVKADSTKIKFQILKLYFQGQIDNTDNPYPHWHKIVEIARNLQIGFLDPSNFNSDTITIDSKEVDMKFLRRYGNIRRHSDHHANAPKYINELKKDPQRVIYMSNPQKAKEHYLKNLEIIIDHFILQHKLC